MLQLKLVVFCTPKLLPEKDSGLKLLCVLHEVKKGKTSKHTVIDRITYELDENLCMPSKTPTLVFDFVNPTPLKLEFFHVADENEKYSNFKYSVLYYSELSLSEVMSSLGQSCAKILTPKKIKKIDPKKEEESEGEEEEEEETDERYIILKSEYNFLPDVSINITFSGHSLKPMNRNGKSNPFFIVKKNFGKEWRETYKSEPVLNTLEPKWKPKRFHITDFSHGYREEEQFLFECWNKNRFSSNQLIGTQLLTVSDLKRDRSLKFDIFHNDNNEQNKETTGKIEVEKCVFSYPNCKIMDLLRSGLNIRLMTAFDFSPTSSSKKSSPIDVIPEDYEHVMRIFGHVFDSHSVFDKCHTCFGFGAKLPLTNEISECFAMNGNEEMPYVFGIRGIIDSFRSCKDRVKKICNYIRDGQEIINRRKNISKIISKVIEICSSQIMKKNENQQQHQQQQQEEDEENNIVSVQPSVLDYLIVIIFVHEEELYEDIEEMKKKLVIASYLPISIIFVVMNSSNDEYDNKKQESIFSNLQLLPMNQKRRDFITVINYKYIFKSSNSKSSFYGGYSESKFRKDTIGKIEEHMRYYFSKYSKPDFFNSPRIVSDEELVLEMRRKRDIEQKMNLQAIENTRNFQERYEEQIQRMKKIRELNLNNKYQWKKVSFSTTDNKPLVEIDCSGKGWEGVYDMLYFDHPVDKLVVSRNLKDIGIHDPQSLQQMKRLKNAHNDNVFSFLQWDETTLITTSDEIRTFRLDKKKQEEEEEDIIIIERTEDFVMDNIEPVYVFKDSKDHVAGYYNATKINDELFVSDNFGDLCLIDFTKSEITDRYKVHEEDKRGDNVNTVQKIVVSKNYPNLMYVVHKHDYEYEDVKLNVTRRKEVHVCSIFEVNSSSGNNKLEKRKEFELWRYEKYSEEASNVFNMFLQHNSQGEELIMCCLKDKILVYNMTCVVENKNKKEEEEENENEKTDLKTAKEEEEEEEGEGQGGLEGLEGEGKSDSAEEEIERSEGLVKKILLIEPFKKEGILKTLERREKECYGNGVSVPMMSVKSNYLLLLPKKEGELLIFQFDADSLELKELKCLNISGLEEGGKRKKKVYSRNIIVVERKDDSLIKFASSITENDIHSIGLWELIIEDDDSMW